MKQRGEERRIGSPPSDVSPAVGDRFRRRKPRASGNLITSRRSTALIRDLSRWNGRRAAKIEPALTPPPEREGSTHGQTREIRNENAACRPMRVIPSRPSLFIGFRDALIAFNCFSSTPVRVNELPSSCGPPPRDLVLGNQIVRARVSNGYLASIPSNTIRI